jgi:hypothetical protein
MENNKFTSITSTEQMTTDQIYEINQEIRRRNTDFWNAEWCLFPEIRHPSDREEVAEMRANEIAMLKEEIQEWIDAIAKWDRVEILDSLLDTHFVSEGTRHKMWEPNDPTDSRREAALDVANKSITLYSLMDVVDELEQLTKLRMNKARRQLIGILLSYIWQVALQLAEREAKGKVYEAMKEVIRSNFTKFPMEKDANGKVIKSNNFRKPSLWQYIS